MLQMNILEIGRCLKERRSAIGQLIMDGQTFLYWLVKAYVAK
jgi:hypothetical protein